MKKIETTINPHYWDLARAVLETLHVPATLREVKTYGRTPPKQVVYRGSRHVLDTTPELELTVFVQDEMLDSTLLALGKVITDAEFLVSSVEGVVLAHAPRAGKAVPATQRVVPVLRAASAFAATMSRA